MIRNYFQLSTGNSMELKDRYLMLLEHEEILLQKKYEVEKQLALIQRIKLEFEETSIVDTTRRRTAR